MSASVLSMYRRLSARPFGHWLFSRLVCFKAPYFASIRPRITRLEPNRGEATISHRRGVTNHLGTVHAIALCNAAELAAGTMTDASIPTGCRWIPRGMTVEYLAKAKGDVRAVADGSAIDWSQTGDVKVPVVAYVEDTPVFRAEITMYVSQA